MTINPTDLRSSYLLTKFPLRSLLLGFDQNIKNSSQVQYFKFIFIVKVVILWSSKKKKNDGCTKQHSLKIWTCNFKWTPSLCNYSVKSDAMKCLLALLLFFPKLHYVLLCVTSTLYYLCPARRRCTLYTQRYLHVNFGTSYGTWFSE